MSERFEEAVIANCAPTLAGHKCGSLFSWRKTGGQDLAQELSSVNRLLQPKGVRVRLLKCCPAGALVYVYRPAMRISGWNAQTLRTSCMGRAMPRSSCPTRWQRWRATSTAGRNFPTRLGFFWITRWRM